MQFLAPLVNLRSLLGLFLISAMISGQALANTFDPGKLASKEIQKAERLIDRFTKRVDEAEIFLQKSQPRLAHKRILDAQKLYKKIAEPFYFHPKLLVSKAQFDKLEQQITAALEREALKKNIEKYQKKITEAKKHLKRNDRKNYQRYLARAEKIYLAIAEHHRQHPQLIQAKADYDLLVQNNSVPAATADASKKSSEQSYGLDSKSLKKAQRYATRYQKKIAEARRFFERKDANTTQRRLTDAQKIYGKIAPAYQSHPSVQTAKAEFDQMHSVVTQVIQQKAQHSQKVGELRITRVAFISEASDLSSQLHYLKIGKDGTSRIDLHQLDNLVSNFSAIQSFKDNCQGKYKDIRQAFASETVDKLSIAEIFDLAENSQQYLQNLIDNSMSSELDKLLAEFNQQQQQLLQHNQIFSGTLDQLGSEGFAEHFTIIKSTRSICQQLKLPLPPQVAKIKAVSHSFAESIEQIQSKLSFDQADYPYQTEAMKKTAQRLAKTLKMELVYIGMAENRWHIDKNELGIPLRKTGRGYALFHRKGDQYYRGIEVSLNRPFNGTSYEPISGAQPTTTVTIYRLQ